MREIGVRELKIRASEIVRNVRERRTRYVITYHGRPVGVLAPLEGAEPGRLAAGESTTSVWDDLTRLGQDISQDWPAGKTSADVLAEMLR